MSQKNLPVVVLVSGRGSNLQSIIDAMQDGRLDIDIQAVISNRPRAAALEKARQAGLDTITVDHTKFSSREEFDQALQETIDPYQPGLIVLAGFMRILTPGFVSHYHGHMLNIHPSLLPKYPGLETHRRVLENGEKKHGASIHFVTNELDGGPVVSQVEVDVLENDTTDSLAARVLEREHPLYCQAIQWIAEEKLKLDNGQVLFNGKPLNQPRIMSTKQQSPT
ncbi:MAG TPA: phosphoribosylglycinamide formyltransferase [Gammaproteobacteria bacterium]|nr:phosphoribosylglycinamide formyltransferase [Gammaproteobacteria bacterium]